MLAVLAVVEPLVVAVAVLSSPLVSPPAPAPAPASAAVLGLGPAIPVSVAIPSSAASVGRVAPPFLLLLLVLLDDRLDPPLHLPAVVLRLARLGHGLLLVLPAREDVLGVALAELGHLLIAVLLLAEDVEGFLLGRRQPGKQLRCLHLALLTARHLLFTH